MSRLGKKPIDIPNNVKVLLDNGKVTVEGVKGKLEYISPSSIKVEIKDNKIIVQRSSDSKASMSLHGLVRTLLVNMIEGVTKGYQKSLEIRGVGYKAQIKEKAVNIALGFSHSVEYPIPDGITIEAPKPTQLIIKGIDKAKVGEIAAELRDFYKPEPYKGKGIRYVDEYVKHKAGKTVA